MQKKYPRTYHLTFSPQIHSDDKTITKEYLNNFINRRVIILEKLDGGNCCWKNGNVYARTHAAPAAHPSFDPIKNMYYGLQHVIPNNLSIFGENMYGIHSIVYEGLESFFYVFNMLDMETNTWLSWDDVVQNCQQFGLSYVPVVFDGVFKNLKDIENFMRLEANKPSALGVQKEGFVIRVADSFGFNEFSAKAAKYVRENHVQSDQRWETNWQAAKLKK